MKPHWGQPTTAGLTLQPPTLTTQTTSLLEAPSLPLLTPVSALGAEKEIVLTSGTHNPTNRQKLLHRQTDANTEEESALGDHRKGAADPCLNQG